MVMKILKLAMKGKKKKKEIEISVRVLKLGITSWLLMLRHALGMNKTRNCN
jgi:hypothetical protein